MFQPSTWGYPFNIAQDRGNKFTVNVWSYRKLMDVIELKAQEYGMKVFEVVEYASKYCAYHNVKVKRHPRGVVTCPKGHKLHSDLNSALNILKKAIGMVILTIKKPLSFIVEHNRVAPVKGVTLETSGTPRPSGRGGAQKSKELNKRFHSLPFRKLQEMIKYKALLEGIEVRHLPKKEVRNTSKTCHRCGHD